MNRSCMAVLTALLISSTQTLADESSSTDTLRGVKAGFGYDRGFGAMVKYGAFQGFAGNDGFALDYELVRESLNAQPPVAYYIAGGGYIDWDGDFGVRVPVGIDWAFAPQWDAYLQAVPLFQIHDDSKFKLDAGVGIRYAF